MRLLLILISIALLVFNGCCGVTSPQNSYYYGSNPSNQNPVMPLPEPKPNLDATISGCTTNFGLNGETTTVWVTLSNTGDGLAEDVIVTYEASDPDYQTAPTSPLGVVPAQKQITVSRTLDTRFGQPTDVRVTINSKNSYPIVRDSGDCRQLDEATKQNLNILVNSGMLPI